MDETNQRILDILREDARTPYTDIADEVGVSEGTVRNRVERMVDEGVIETFTVEVNRGMSALVMVDLATGVDVEEVLDRIPDGIWFYEVTGEHDLVVSIESETSQVLNEVIESIRSVDGVIDTKTYTVLNQGIS